MAFTLRYISSLPDPAAPVKTPRTLAIMGSTGSIGRSALEVIRLQPERFHVAALAGARNLPLLAAQAAEFRPEHLAVLEEDAIPALRALLPKNYAPAILSGQAGYERLAGLPGVDMLLSAQVGAAGLRATFAAARAGKLIALANKESLVLAGGLIRAACAESGACILPVDSEHNALFQCLAANLAPGGGKDVSRLILTASGGPFYGKTQAELDKVTPEQALAHPNWTMGAKVTIDSATLMNKGLELIEAHHLYGLPLEAIEVLVHRESIIHSLAEFTDGSQLAQMGRPDMRIPIACCLGYPERLATGADKLDLASVGALRFARPDETLFPCLGLARRAQERGLGSPVVLNAANEIAVAAFLDGRLPFPAIAVLVRRCLEAHEAGLLPRPPANSPAGRGPDAEPDSLEAVLALDHAARAFAAGIAAEI